MRLENIVLQKEILYIIVQQEHIHQKVLKNVLIVQEEHIHQKILQNVLNAKKELIHQKVLQNHLHVKKGHIQIKKVHQYVYHETEELIQKKKVHQIVIFPDDSASFPGRDEGYQCPQVTYSPNAGSLCLNYPAGTTSNKSETSCHECSIGRYVDKGI